MSTAFLRPHAASVSGRVVDGTIAPTAEDVLASHFSLVAVPGEIELMDVAGAEGWKAVNPHPVLSIGRWTTDDPNEAAAALDAVATPFREARRGFDWMTGPSETELLPLLTERGFLDAPLRVSAMVRPLLGEETLESVATPPGISIRKEKEPDRASVWGVMADGFDIPSEVARIYHDAYFTPSHRQRTDVYTAIDEGIGEPVGVGYLSYIGQGPMVLLRVSATLESHRNRGVYRALVEWRLADAARAGRGVAVVHAYSEGSKGALADLGFASVGELLLHRWRP